MKCTPRFLALALLVLAALPTTQASWSQVAQPTPDTQLAEAKRLFDALNYEAAAAALDTLVATVEPLAAADAAAAKILASALELRGHTRFFLNNADGARADFRALLKLAPGYTLTGQVSSRVRALFTDVQKATIGKMVLNLAPVDAELELDGRPFTPTAGAIPAVAGSHTLSGKKPGFQSRSVPFTIAPNETKEVELTLERIAATVTLVTIPPDVQVSVDGVARGRTVHGPPPSKWNELIEKANGSPASASGEYLIDDLGLGNHVIEFQRTCYTPFKATIAVETLKDLRMNPVRLDKAVASIYVDVPTAGATVLFDGEPRGPVPLTLEDVCEGDHAVEVRSPWGRYAERMSTHAGDKLTVQGTLKPAVALLSVTSLPEGYRGTDLRLTLERAMAAAKTINLFAAPAEQVQQALKAEALTPGWLAFDRWRRPLGAAAAGITPPARLEIAGKLAKALDVQGVAELTARPGGGQTQFVLSILSAESAEPDVLELSVDSPASLNAAVARLDALPALYQPSVGLGVADVLDVSGAVVIAVDGAGSAAQAGLAPGDVITSADGEGVADGTAFLRVVRRHKAGDKLAVQVSDRAGNAKAVQLTVSMAPRLVAMNDQSVLFNNLGLSLRARVSTTGGAPPDPVLRLNLAVALMRLGNWAAARTELSKVQLPPGPGVSKGTVEDPVGPLLRGSRAGNGRRTRVARSGGRRREPADGGWPARQRTGRAETGRGTKVLGARRPLRRRAVGALSREAWPPAWAEPRVWGPVPGPDQSPVARTSDCPAQAGAGRPGSCTALRGMVYSSGSPALGNPI